uniref:Uncharacterized protein n=1 Tax=Corethron hystrix TaxID=216773 RepID=A0A7S1B2X8_9STRA|mmetsp:Transcript_10303/g.22894  ORF Transcript_10303/g.22894 Transcript_10303/m.22894 type:complete len:449 (+) Transcript_10303:93-1439(+)
MSSETNTSVVSVNDIDLSDLIRQQAALIQKLRSDQNKESALSQKFIRDTLKDATIQTITEIIMHGSNVPEVIAHSKKSRRQTEGDVRPHTESKYLNERIISKKEKKINGTARKWHRNKSLANQKRGNDTEPCPDGRKKKDITASISIVQSLKTVSVLAPNISHIRRNDWGGSHVLWLQKSAHLVKKIGGETPNRRMLCSSPLPPKDIIIRNMPPSTPNWAAVVEGFDDHVPSSSSKYHGEKNGSFVHDSQPSRPSSRMMECHKTHDMKRNFAAEVITWPHEPDTSPIPLSAVDCSEWENHLARRILHIYSTTVRSASESQSLAANCHEATTARQFDHDDKDYTYGKFANACDVGQDNTDHNQNVKPQESNCTQWKIFNGGKQLLLPKMTQPQMIWMRGTGNLNPDCCALEGTSQFLQELCLGAFVFGFCSSHLHLLKKYYYLQSVFTS